MLGFLGTLMPVLGTVLDKVLPDPEAKAKALAEFQSQVMQMDLAQMEVNKAEAAAPGWFKGGWRPAIGWVCSFALAWQYVIAPLGTWVAGIYGADIPPPPSLDGQLWELTLGMLGMGGIRMYEKLKGKA